MQKMRIKCLAMVLSVMAATASHAAPAIEAPVVMPEAMLSITAPDLHGLIDGVGIVAAQVSPMMNGAMLKNMLGMQLGDPGLAGIAPGTGLAIVALDPTNFFAVIEVGEAQAAAYANVVGAMGVQSKYEGGVLVLGQTPGQLTKGLGMAKAVKASLLAKRSPTIRIALQPAAMIERNSAAIQGFMQMMPMIMGAGMMQTPGVDTNMVANTTKILEGELRLLLSIAGQCESGELVLAPANGSLRINKTFTPKAGTRLAALMNAPQVNKPNPKIQSGLLDSGTLLLDCTMGNPDAMVDFFVAESEQLLSEMKLKDADTAALLANLKKWMGLYGGTFCESVNLGGTNGLSVGYLMEVKDAKGVLALFKTMEQDMAPLLKIYKDLGVPMEMAFKENAREYKGIPIHTFTVTMDLKSMAGDQQKQFEAMNLGNMSYDMAISDGIMVYAMGPGKIEVLLDRLKDPATTVQPLKARAVYPEGGFYYLDLDIGSYMQFVAAMMPKGASDPLTDMASVFKGASPVTSAGFRENGRVMWSVNVPGDLLAKYGQLVMMMQMQKMQQQMPQAMPVQ